MYEMLLKIIEYTAVEKRPKFQIPCFSISPSKIG